MKVLVTGSAGGIGKVVARWLAHQGWEVRQFDHAPESKLADVEYISGDITRFESVREAMRSCEAVVHLAAIPAPLLATGDEIFRVNASGTFNVFEAAAAEGIRRVVQASSINAIGCAWNIADMVLPYLPVDEDYPRETNDPYSFSKHVVEDIGEYYWRRDKISSVSFRFPWVYPEGYAESEHFFGRRKTGRQVVDKLLTLDEVERQTQLAAVRARALDFRARRMMETPDGIKMYESEDPVWAAYTFDRFNFWAFVDVRDAARAFERSLLADFEGHHALFLNDPYNWLDYDTQTLIRVFYPEVRQFKTPMAGSAALVSIDRAKTLLGYEPAFSIGAHE